MKTSIRTATVTTLLVISLSSARVLQDNGIAGYTGSPGENNCTNCHNSFAINSGGGSISIATTPSISTGGYVPGTTYTISVTVAKTGVNLFGFGTEILNSSNTNAGTISVLNSTQTKLLSSSGKTNIVHQLNGGAGSSGTKTFDFKWVAPSTAVAATVYAAGVAANGNGSSSSDYVYKTSLSLSAPVGIEEQSFAMHMDVYPNPVTENVTLSYMLKEDAEVEYSLTSLGGKLIKIYDTEKQLSGDHKQVLEIPLSVTEGLYLLNMKVNGKNISHRIIINR